jgi:hypothetical protein
LKTLGDVLRETPAEAPKSGHLILIWMLSPTFVGPLFYIYFSRSPQTKAPKITTTTTYKWAHMSLSFLVLSPILLFLLVLAPILFLLMLIFYVSKYVYFLAYFTFTYINMYI